MKQRIAFVELGPVESLDKEFFVEESDMGNTSSAKDDGANREHGTVVQQRHTPGPWHYERLSDCANTGEEFGYIFGADGKMVAESVYKKDAIAICSTRALLTALEAIENETRKGGQWGYAEINECARAAIALAK